MNLILLSCMVNSYLPKVVPLIWFNTSLEWFVSGLYDLAFMLMVLFLLANGLSECKALIGSRLLRTIVSFFFCLFNISYGVIAGLTVINS
jgi:hypothetical protein